MSSKLINKKNQDFLIFTTHFPIQLCKVIVANFSMSFSGELFALGSWSDCPIISVCCCSDGYGSLVCRVAAGYHAAPRLFCAAASAWGLLVCCYGGFLQGLCNCIRTSFCTTLVGFLRLPTYHFFLFMAAALVGRWMGSLTFSEAVGAAFGKD